MFKYSRIGEAVWYTLSDCCPVNFQPIIWHQTKSELIVTTTIDALVFSLQAVNMTSSSIETQTVYQMFLSEMKSRGVRTLTPTARVRANILKSPLLSSSPKTTRNNRGSILFSYWNYGYRSTCWFDWWNLTSTCHEFCF